MPQKILLALVILASLAACNTIRGVGQDMTAVGETISREADRPGTRM